MELSGQLAESERANSQLENAIFNLNDQLRQIKSKQESQVMELSNTLNDLKNKTRKLEDDQHLTVKMHYLFFFLILF